MQLFADGRAPQYLRRWYGGGALVGIGKPGTSLDEDTRPIVTGEVWRRLTFKCVFALERAHVSNHLRPNQVAIGSAGVEIVTHTARQWFADHATSTATVFLKRDKSNAFNAANPDEFLRDCHEHMPNCARFAEYCYGQPINLIYNGRIEQSYRGQQGCPAMEAMFCLMQKRMSADVHATLRDVPGYIPEFADDSYLGGSTDAVLQCFLAEIALARRYHVEFDFGKCILYLPAGANYTGDLAGFEQLGIKVIREPNVEMLKTPIVGSTITINKHPVPRATGKK